MSDTKTEAVLINAGLLEEILDALDAHIDTAADRHYSTIIFSADRPGQTPEEKYREQHAADDAALVEEGRAALYAE